MELNQYQSNVDVIFQAGVEEEQCPVCWGMLCEPVLWPECSHQFCLLCTLKTRQRPKPSCPLCRSPAARVLNVDSLLVDSLSAARVRQSVGFSAYISQRRKLLAAAVEAPQDLEAMPIYCTGLNTKRLRLGKRIGLRLSEPRYCEIVKRAMAPGGSRRFVAVTRSRNCDEIPIGARGCLFEIVDSSEGTDGLCQVIVEVGSACKVLAVKAEDMQQGPPLLIGRLEQFEEDDGEDDEENSTYSGDADENDVVELDEEEQLETLRERVQLLELLNIAMLLEQARLEQRRLELTMLLSQRRLYQELIDLGSELGGLARLPSARHHLGGIASASASEQRRPSAEDHGYVARNAHGQKSPKAGVGPRQMPQDSPSPSPSSPCLVDNLAQVDSETNKHSLATITRQSGLAGALSAGSQFRPSIQTISLNDVVDRARHQSRGVHDRRALNQPEHSQHSPIISRSFSGMRASRNTVASGTRSITNARDRRSYM